jgi:hypothetical protein
MPTRLMAERLKQIASRMRELYSTRPTRIHGGFASSASGAMIDI